MAEAECKEREWRTSEEPRTSESLFVGFADDNDDHEGEDITWVFQSPICPAELMRPTSTPTV
jgi:hypothetical protein